MANPKQISDYNTAINVLGGLHDLSVIEEAFHYVFEHEEISKSRLPKDLFGSRTEKSYKRFDSVIRNTILLFSNREHKLLLKSVFSKGIPLQDRNMVLFWQLALNNRLFREITEEVFIPVYWSGRASLPRDEILSYLKELKYQNPDLTNKWSDYTTEIIATKYLKLMSKIGLVEDDQKKSFTSFSISTEAIITFLYFSRIADPTQNNLLKNSFITLSMIPKEDLIARLKKLSMKGYFEMDYNGVNLNLNLNHSEEELGHVLYH